MAKVSIAVRNLMGSVRAEAEGEDQAVLVFKGEYKNGDTIHLAVEKSDCFYVIRIDDGMDEALVYLTRPYMFYTIPFDEKRLSYNPKAFTGAIHYLTIRRAEAFEVQNYRNLAKNTMDQPGDQGCFPHAFANVENRGEAVLAARNVIDGIIANTSHGKWPYGSWGIRMQDDAEFTLAFGRPVDFDRIILYIRADFPHDSGWAGATLSFSDGTSEAITLEKSSKAQIFSIERKKITWLKLEKLIKAEEPSPFLALTQIAVYGREAEDCKL